MKLKVSIVTTSEGDWEVAYFNGEKTYESHSLQSFELLQFLGDFIEANGPVEELEVKGYEIDAFLLESSFDNTFPDDMSQLTNLSQW